MFRIGRLSLCRSLLISTETEKGVTAVVIGSSQTIAFSTVVSTQPLRSVTLVGSPSTRGMLGLAQKMEVNISLSSGDDGDPYKR